MVQIKVVNGVIVDLDSWVGFERDIRTKNGVYTDAAGNFINDAYSKYADCLFIREYDGVVKDVVIIKAYSDDYSAECILRSAE